MAAIPCSSPAPATPSVVHSLPVPRLSVVSLEWRNHAPPIPPMLEEVAAQADGQVTLLPVANSSSDLLVSTYDRTQLRHGIVHIGVGAFHRGHFAVYMDRWLDQQAKLHTGGSNSSTGDSDDWRSWGICGVGLQASDTAMRDALVPQDCLYSVTERSSGAESTTRIVRCMTEFVQGGPGGEECVLVKLAARDTRIVSLTITEGGYYTDSEGALDTAHPNLAADIAAERLTAPRSIYGYLAAALARRRTAGLPPFTVLSCDNISGNGDLVCRLLLDFLRRRGAADAETGAELAEWLNASGRQGFPNTMVDRICPRTSSADIGSFASRFHLADAWPVVCEPFSQFVVQEAFVCGRPHWEAVGVQMVTDVHPYEVIKLRILNAAHSALGYLGYLAGHTYVHEVVQSSLFARFLRRLLHAEVGPLLQPPADVHLDTYIETVLARFANPTIGDTLARICMHGSAKMPKFLLPSVLDYAASGAGVASRDRLLLLCVAGWLRYATGIDQRGQPFLVDDVFADELRNASHALQHYEQTATTSVPVEIQQRLGLVLPPTLVADAAWVTRLAQILRCLHQHGVQATIEQTMREIDAIEPHSDSKQPLQPSQMDLPKPRWGAVELGGTTIKVAVAVGSPTNVIEQRSFPTGASAETLARAAQFFEGQSLTALGIGSFGPLDLNEQSSTYGFITSTPKSGWQDVDVVGAFRHLNVPLAFSTDVNVAAFGEYQYGRHGALAKNCVYITVGTGVGCGIVVDGRLITGLVHPEGGHLPVRRHPLDPPSAFGGLCPAHGDCLEGLASARAIAARYALAPEELASLPDSHPAWDIEAFYLAQLCAALTFLVSPHVIVLGGGVPKRACLLPLVRAHLHTLLNGYVRHPKLQSRNGLDEYVVSSRFDTPDSNTSAGCVGALAFAEHIFTSTRSAATTNTGH